MFFFEKTEYYGNGYKLFPIKRCTKIIIQGLRNTGFSFLLHIEIADFKINFYTAIIVKEILKIVIVRFSYFLFSSICIPISFKDIFIEFIWINGGNLMVNHKKSMKNYTYNYNSY